MLRLWQDQSFQSSLAQSGRGELSTHAASVARSILPVIFGPVWERRTVYTCCVRGKINPSSHLWPSLRGELCTHAASVARSILPVICGPVSERRTVYTCCVRGKINPSSHLWPSLGEENCLHMLRPWQDQSFQSSVAQSQRGELSTHVASVARSILPVIFGPVSERRTVYTCCVRGKINPSSHLWPSLREENCLHMLHPWQDQSFQSSLAQSGRGELSTHAASVARSILPVICGPVSERSTVYTCCVRGKINPSSHLSSLAQSRRGELCTHAASVARSILPVICGPVSERRTVYTCCVRGKINPSSHLWPSLGEENCVHMLRPWLDQSFQSSLAQSRRGELCTHAASVARSILPVIFGPVSERRTVYTCCVRG